MPYTKTIFVENSAPGISAQWLNKLGDTVLEHDKNCVRMYESTGTQIITTNATTVGQGLPLAKKPIAATLSIRRFTSENLYINIPDINLVLFADQSNQGRVYINVPDSDSSVRYPLSYFFTASNGELILRVVASSTFILYNFILTWYYTEY